MPIYLMVEYYSNGENMTQLTKCTSTYVFVGRNRYRINVYVSQHYGLRIGSLWHTSKVFRCSSKNHENKKTATQPVKS